MLSEISDFLAASNLGEVLSHLTNNTDGSKDSDEANKFTARSMRHEHKESVIE